MKPAELIITDCQFLESKTRAHRLVQVFQVWNFSTCNSVCQCVHPRDNKGSWWKRRAIKKEDVRLVNSSSIGEVDPKKYHDRMSHLVLTVKGHSMENFCVGTCADRNVCDRSERCFGMDANRP